MQGSNSIIRSVAGMLRGLRFGDPFAQMQPRCNAMTSAVPRIISDPYKAAHTVAGLHADNCQLHKSHRGRVDFCHSG